METLISNFSPIFFIKMLCFRTALNDRNHSGSVIFITRLKSLRVSNKCHPWEWMATLSLEY